MTEVACVRLIDRFAVLEDGETLPLARLYDRFGDETDETDEAVSCTAGPDRDGLWVQIDLTAFQGVRLQ